MLLSHKILRKALYKYQTELELECLRILQEERADHLGVLDDVHDVEVEIETINGWFTDKTYVNLKLLKGIGRCK